MQYEVYDPTKHTLSAWTRIRLAGREGEISRKLSKSDMWDIHWDDLSDTLEMELLAFPLLEVGVPAPKIDKRVKQRIISTYENWSFNDNEGCIESLLEYINSLEER